MLERSRGRGNKKEPLVTDGNPAKSNAITPVMTVAITQALTINQHDDTKVVIPATPPNLSTDTLAHNETVMINAVLARAQLVLYAASCLFKGQDSAKQNGKKIPELPKRGSSNQNHVDPRWHYSEGCNVRMAVNRFAKDTTSESSLTQSLPELPTFKI